MKDDRSIITKGADKVSVVVLWDREDYLKKAYRQLDDKEVYEQVPKDPSVLAGTLMKALEKIWDLSKDTLDYFLVKDPKFARFYLLPKIHKRLHDVPGRPVTLNCGYHTENISSFLDYHFQLVAQKVKLYIKDTNHFLSKSENLPLIHMSSYTTLIFCGFLFVKITFLQKYSFSQMFSIASSTCWSSH